MSMLPPSADKVFEHADHPHAPRILRGPRGDFFFGSLYDLRADWLGYMAYCEQTYGQIVRFRMPWPINEIVLVTAPHLIERVFLTDAESFKKPFSSRMLAPIFGDGVFLAEGSAWKRQRRMLQPAFHRSKVASYFEVMVNAAEAMVDSWRTDSERGVLRRDVFEDATTLTFRIAGRTMFGVKLDKEADRASQALTDAMRAFSRLFNSRLPLPLAIPTKKALALRRAGRKLELIVDEFIAERKQSTEEHCDLLSMLLQTRYEDGSLLSDRAVRDEAMTAFAAGSETSAVALAWTLYLLARHPKIAEQIQAEVSAVAGESRLQDHHLPLLKFTERTVKESMRLFPPGWAIAREAARDVDLDGFRIKKGAQIFTCPYLTQRNPEYFPEPERFNPDRWSDTLAGKLPKFAYFPFGGGQRVCIGSAFAMMELVVTVAIVARRTRLEATPLVPKPIPGFTLRPRGGVNLHVSMRS